LFAQEEITNAKANIITNKYRVIFMTGIKLYYVMMCYM